MEKINVAELLKDCPKGMELDCPLFENLEFDRIDKDNGAYSIICCVKTEWECYNTHTFTEYGCYSTEKYSKCVIFPKGKTTWEGFQKPFKDGDIVATQNGIWIGIHKRMVGNAHEVYLAINHDCLIYNDNIFYFNRLATEEEKQKLFDAIKANGYKWNEETKTLEKLIEPKFKVGDRVKKKDSNEDIVLITDIADNYYIVETKYGMEVTISMSIQNNYELVPNKFDITTLKPFDKVLVRDHNAQEWVASLFSNYNEPKKYKYICVNGSGYAQCIPYEGNEHLLGTTNDCDNFYKTWE